LLHRRNHTNWIPASRRTETCGVIESKKKGFYRIAVEEQIVDIDDFYKEKAIGEHPPEFYILVDRIRFKGNRQRIADALETAFREGDGNAIVEAAGRSCSTAIALNVAIAGLLTIDPIPESFPSTARTELVRKCQGFGNIMDLDPDKIIPDASLSLEEFPIAPWNNMEYRWMYKYAKEAKNLPQNVPLSKFNETQKRLLWEGDGHYPGIKGF
jgi:excinuclease ABC subunit A